MIKNIIFVVLMAVVSVLLSMLEMTGMAVHIAISVVGLILLVVYALTTKKTWKCPALEVIGRVFYAIALITGVVIMNVHGIVALNIIHRACATLFVVIFAVTEIHKAIKK